MAWPISFSSNLTVDQNSYIIFFLQFLKNLKSEKWHQISRKTSYQFMMKGNLLNVKFVMLTYFENKANLKKHAKSVHEAKKTFKCPVI